MFRTDTRLVVLNASVFDAAGHFLPSLPQEAFHVFENGTPQRISLFRREDVPISLGLVVDRSPSMAAKRDRVASAALALIRASHPEDEAFVLNFDEDAYLDQDFTSDIAKLEHGLRLLDSARGTAIRDALRLAVTHLKQRGAREKKVALVVTDGEDNSSRLSIEQLVRMAQQNEVIVFAIGLLGNEEPSAAARARRDLDLLTRSTGGRAWYPDQVREVEGIAREVAHEIRNQYILGYTPADQPADGSYRRIQVRVDVPGAVVHTRTGYYAMPETASRANP